MTRFLASVWPLTCTAIACTGDIVDGPALQQSALPGSAGGSTPRVYAGDASTSAPNDETASGSSASCPVTPSAAPAPLARLTNLEYQNTLRDLLPGITLPAVTLPDDIVVEGFDNNAKAQTPSPALVEQYQIAAQSVAAAIAVDPSVVLPCTAQTTAQQESCGSQFIEQFVTRAYRRPITAEETERYSTLLHDAQSLYDFPSAVAMVVQAALQTPHFLYRVELGGPAQNGAAPLTAYELASRLSYFFWDTAPDDALLNAAGSGTLDSAAGVETQARRLLDDTRAHAAVANLFKQWLRFDKMKRMEKDPALYPQWNENVAESLRSATTQFVDHVFWELDGSLDALLTSTDLYVDGNTAAIYGASAAGSGMTLLQADPAQRSGILTQPGLLAAFAHETNDSPILRGVFVMDRLLCSAPPPPPPGVTGSITETSANAAAMTTRDRVAMTHEQGDCAACHHSIDGFGFGFSHYDALGRWRDTENGLTVNAKGWIANTRDADGEFDGVVELGQRLAQSSHVSDCVASQWFRYALGLGAADVKTCTLAATASAFRNSQGDLRELMIATVTSDAFRHRPEVTP